MPSIELIEKRTRNSKTHSLGGRKYSWDGTIGSIHYEDNGWQEIDNYFEPAVAPWDWQMLHAGYHIRVKEDFTAGQITEFEKQGETVQFQPMALEWTNDLDQIQPIAMPHEVSPAITNPEVDLLPAVGMPSYQGTIRWNDAYGEGLDFQWKCSSTRLVKILEIENLNNLIIPEQYILDGGNPVLRLNLIFDPSDLDIYVDDKVWDKKTKKQTFSIIEFRKDGEVLWGFMPLRYWGSNPEAEDNEGQSVATLEKRGNKLYISIRVPYDWLQNAVYPVFIDTDVDETVIDGKDDAYERGAGGFYPDLDYAYMQRYSSDTSNNYRCYGLRWRTVNVPKEATIITAYHEVYINDSEYADSPAGKIYANKVASAVNFEDDADIIGRVRTDGTGVDGDGYTAWVAVDIGYNDWKGSNIELKNVIQEIVNQGTWAANNNLVLLGIADLDGLTVFCFYTYDKNAIYGAKLHIEYEEAGGETHYGAATLSGVGTLAGIPHAIFIGKATLAGGGTLAAIGRGIYIGVASLTGDGSLSAIGSFLRYAKATLAGVGTLVGKGALTAIGKATLTGTGSLATIGSFLRYGKAMLSGQGTLAAIGTVITGGVIHYGSVALSGIGTLTASGVRVFQGAVTLAGSGTLAGIGHITAIGKATLSGVGTLVGIGRLIVIGKATLSGIGTLAGIGRGIFVGTATLTGSGTLAAIGSFWRYGVATLSGTGTLAAIGRGLYAGKATLVGVGTLASSAVITVIGKVTLTGTGTLTVIGGFGRLLRIVVVTTQYRAVNTITTTYRQVNAITAYYRKVKVVTAHNRLVKAITTLYRKVKVITSGG